MAFASAPPPTLAVRGGGGDIFSDLAPLFAQVTRVVQTHVEPILKDPNGRILQPLREFAKQRAEETKRRQARYRSNPPQALGFAVLSPTRIVRMGVTAMILAELLDYLGALDDPRAAKKRVVNAFKTNANVPTLQRRTQNWWKGARRRGGLLHVQTWSSTSSVTNHLATWQPKHQFAIGAGGGLMLTHLFWCVAHHALKTGVVIYTLSELNALIKQQSGQSVSERFGTTKFGAKVEIGLEDVRGAVRSAAKDPAHLVETIPNLVGRYVPDVGLPQGTKTGFMAGLVVGIVIV